MNEVLSTMGDKLKNLQQQVKKERESNKTNKSQVTQNLQTPHNLQNLQTPHNLQNLQTPQNPRIIGTSSTFLGGRGIEGDASLGGNSRWESLTEEALSASPPKVLVRRAEE